MSLAEVDDSIGEPGSPFDRLAASEEAEVPAGLDAAYAPATDRIG